MTSTSDSPGDPARPLRPAWAGRNYSLLTAAGVGGRPGAPRARYAAPGAGGGAGGAPAGRGGGGRARA
ncbi:MFS transporter, partial [Streptomyces sp. NPDC127079]